MKLVRFLAIASGVSAQLGMCGNYGCVKDMDTTGCSGTCNQDGRCTSGGVTCSGRLASNDFNKLKDFRVQARAAGSRKNIDHYRHFNWYDKLRGPKPSIVDSTPEVQGRHFRLQCRMWKCSNLRRNGYWHNWKRLCERLRGQRTMVPEQRILKLFHLKTWQINLLPSKWLTWQFKLKTLCLEDLKSWGFLS